MSLRLIFWFSLKPKLLSPYRIHMSLVRLQQQKMGGLIHLYTNNWVERSKAIKRLRCRLHASKESASQQHQQRDEAGGKEKSASQAGGSAPVTSAAVGDPYLKLEITKEHIDAISDFSELL